MFTKFWMNLQDRYEIRKTLMEAGDDIERIHHYQKVLSGEND